MKTAYMVISDTKVPMGLFSDRDVAIRYMNEKSDAMANAHEGEVFKLPCSSDVVSINKIRGGSWFTRWERSFAVVKIVLDLNSNL